MSGKWFGRTKGTREKKRIRDEERGKSDMDDRIKSI